MVEKSYFIPYNVAIELWCISSIYWWQWVPGALPNIKQSCFWFEFIINKCIMLKIVVNIGFSCKAYMQEHVIALVSENYEVSCWACGLRLLLPSHSPIFKCGWCGAITNQNSRKSECKYFWLRRLRDRFFVCVLLAFMLFVICMFLMPMRNLLDFPSFFMWKWFYASTYLKK